MVKCWLSLILIDNAAACEQDTFFAGLYLGDVALDHRVLCTVGTAEVFKNRVEIGVTGTDQENISAEAASGWLDDPFALPAVDKLGQYGGTR